MVITGHTQSQSKSQVDLELMTGQIDDLMYQLNNSPPNPFRQGVKGNNIPKE
jgi:hypothetical protein